MAEEKDAPFQNPEYEKNPEKYHLKCLTIVDQVIKGSTYLTSANAYHISPHSEA